MMVSYETSGLQFWFCFVVVTLDDSLLGNSEVFVKFLRKQLKIFVFNQNFSDNVVIIGVHFNVYDLKYFNFL